MAVLTRFFDPDGNPISLEEWGRRFGDFDGRVLLRHTTLADGRQLITVWLGYVDPVMEVSALFGTALMSDGRFIKELGTYQTKAEALLGHARHLEALS